jgi:hypothetical protein
MESAINKIFNNKIDGIVHYEFVKFSRGIFNNRYLLEGKKQKDKWVVKTGNEFANFFVRTLADKLGASSTDVKGIIVSTRNLKEMECFHDILAHAHVKQFMGVKQFQIEQQLTGNEIQKLIAGSPTSFFALSFCAGEDELKIKPKAPKSGKPGTKTKDDDGPKADFCSLKTSDKEIIRDLFFDFPDFKEIKINHTIEIKDIQIPKDAKTPEEKREKAVRKGVMKRIVNADGKREVKEKAFEI